MNLEAIRSESGDKVAFSANTRDVKLLSDEAGDVGVPVEGGVYACSGVLYEARLEFPHRCERERLDPAFDTPFPLRPLVQPLPLGLGFIADGLQNTQMDVRRLLRYTGDV